MSKRKPLYSAIGASLLLGALAGQPLYALAADGTTGSKASVSSVAPARRVTGTVLDENGEPLIGAAVIYGEGKGVITDFDGKFSISDVEEGQCITISYVGYKDYKVWVKGDMNLRIKLESDSQTLDDVVVIGYGVQKKSNVTGSISSIKADDMKNNSMTNAASALQGKVSGVQVVNNSGAPGAAPTIRVRGYSSNGSSDPLYIVDGLKVDDISFLDPSSIQSMEILKDAASAAIYGAEAGNGVVLITTKGGSKGKTLVTFDAQFIFSSVANKVDVMNAEQYTNFYTEALGSDAFNARYDLYNIAGTDTDWQDAMYETGKMQKYNVSFSGGNDDGKFFVSLGYMNNDGIVVMDKDYYKRLNGQVNASYKIKPWLEVGTTNTIMSSTGSTLSESNIQYGLMKGILQSDPLTPLFYDSNNLPTNVQTAIDNGLGVITNSAGQIYGLSYMGNGSSPVAAVEITNQTDKMQSLNGSAYINLTPIKNFIFTSRLGYTIGSVSEQTYSPDRWTNLLDPTSDTTMSLYKQQYSTRYYQWENFANYTYENDKVGNFSLMVGMSYSKYEQDYAGGQTNGLSSTADNFVYLDYSSNTADDYVYGMTTYKRKLAYYGRFSWDFMNRYNFQVNFRADAYDTAYLDFDNKWGYFPSVSIGWTFTEEPFMQKVRDSGVLTFGKFRASYGVNGSVSNLGSYAYASSLNAGTYNTSLGVGNMTYWMDGRLVTGVYPSSVLANPSLKWEESKQVDLGLDLHFFDGSLSVAADYFYKLTDGLLIESTAALTTGSSTVYQNVGKVVNKGFEFEVDYKGKIGKFQYGIKANISTLSNNVKEYKGEGTRIEGSGILSSEYSAMTYFEEGYPLWYIRGFKLAGVDSETGQAIYEDINGDGEITDEDRTCLGKGIPDFTYGLTLTAAYKGFDFSIYGAGASGNKLVYALQSASTDSYQNRLTLFYEDRWTSTNTSASLPSASYQLTDDMFKNSDAYVFSASYFKIKQIQLGYSLPKKATNYLGLQSLRAFVSLENFFTFTDYPGSDPEVNASGNTASALALDYGGYPMAKSVMFGFNVSF